MSETTTFKSPASPAVPAKPVVVETPVVPETPTVPETPAVHETPVIIETPASPVQEKAAPPFAEQSPQVNGTPAEKEPLPTTEIIVTDKDTPTPTNDLEAIQSVPKEDVSSEQKTEDPSTDSNADTITPDPVPAKVSVSEPSNAHSSSSSKKSAKKSNNMKAVVQLLDGSKFDVEITKQTLGEFIFEKVCDYLNLLEKDFFGITYVEKENEETRYWLNLEKKVSKQIKEKNLPWEFAFQVKFYPPDPSQIQEDLTRYMLCLQIRNDILNEKLPCSFVTHALLGSYTVQSELGDYDSTEHGQGIDYIKDFKFAPNQDAELLQNIATLHRQHKGQTPEEAELHFLENAKKLAMYGVDLHEAMDSNNVEILLGVCASGLLVYKDKLRINRFSWPKILKISYKGKSFVIKVRPGEFERYENIISFKLQHHRLAKRLWKTCVEHHTFFRLKEPDSTKPTHVFPRFGSRFRYSGRTQYQTRQNTIDRQNPHFARAGKYSQSYGYDRSRSMDDGNVTSNDPAAVNNRDRLASTDSYGSAGGYPAIATLPRHDLKDRHDKKRGVPTPLATLGMQNKYGDSEDGRVVSAPNVNDADRLERTGSPDSVRTMDFSGEYDATMVESPTATVTMKKPLSEKEEKKREKERKKKEEEERKRREKEEKEREKERKKKEKELAKEKAKGKDKDDAELMDKDALKNSEDRLDKLGHDNSALNLENSQPLSDSQLQGNILIAPGKKYNDDPANMNGTSSPTPEELAAAADRDHKGKDKEKRGLFGKFRKPGGKDSKDKRDVADANIDPTTAQVNNVPDEAYLADKSATLTAKGPHSNKEKKEEIVTTEVILVKETETTQKDQKKVETETIVKEEEKKVETEPSKKDQKKKSGHRSSGLLCLNPFKKKTDKRKSGASSSPEHSDDEKERKGDKLGPGAVNGQAGKEPVKRKGSSSSSSSNSSAEGVLGDEDGPELAVEAKEGILDVPSLPTIISEEDNETVATLDGSSAEPPLPPVVNEGDEPVEGAALGSLNKLDDLPLPPVIVEENEPIDEATPESISQLAEHPSPSDIADDTQPPEKATEDIAREGLPAGVYGGVPGGGQPGYNGELYPGGVMGHAGGPPFEEKWIDNNMTFLPVTKPEKTTKGGYGRPGAPLRPEKPPTAEKPRKKPPPVPPKFSSRTPADQLDVHLHEDPNSSPIPPTVETETIKFSPDLTETPISTKNVPIVKTETRKVSYQKDGLDEQRESEAGVLVSSQAHSSKTQTIETTTYRTEKDGIVETRVERKVTITSDNDDIDHDAALAEAIRSVTEMNPDLSVERIEYMQEIE